MDKLIDARQFEYGSKASIASTAQVNLIVGVVSHEQNLHDSHIARESIKTRHTLPERQKAKTMNKACGY